jgi:hypothetical protein
MDSTLFTYYLSISMDRVITSIWKVPMSSLPLPKNSAVLSALAAKRWRSGERELFQGIPYAKDAARGIAVATENYNKSDPANLGSGKEIRIRDLLEMIAKVNGFKGDIKWDIIKWDGQLRTMFGCKLSEERVRVRNENRFRGRTAKDCCLVRECYEPK